MVQIQNNAGQIGSLNTNTGAVTNLNSYNVTTSTGETITRYSEGTTYSSAPASYLTQDSSGQNFVTLYEPTAITQPKVEKPVEIAPRSSEPVFTLEVAKRLNEEQKGQSIDPTKNYEYRGTYMPTPPLTPSEQLLRYAREGEQKGEVNGYGNDFKSNPVVIIGASTLGTIGGFIEKPQTVVTGPVNFFWSLATKPKETSTEIVKEAYVNPGFFIGQQSGNALTYGVLIPKGAKLTKETYIKAKYPLNPDTILSPQVTEQGKTFPTVSSTKESLQQFNTPSPQGPIKVITTGPTIIKGETIGTGGQASQIGQQDTGVYVTPYGEGSPNFLGINKDGGYSGFTLNPLANIMNTPTASIFEVSKVSKYPREVVKPGGFESVKTFQENIGSKNDVAYLTKRSEVGQGEITPKFYTMPETSTLSFSTEVIRGGKRVNVKAGELVYKGEQIKEVGSVETEAVISKDTLFKYTGQDSYQTYKGEIFKIKEVEIVFDKTKPTKEILKDTETVKKDYSYTYGGRPQKVTPLELGSISSSISQTNKISQSYLTSPITKEYSYNGGYSYKDLGDSSISSSPKIESPTSIVSSPVSSSPIRPSSIISYSPKRSSGGGSSSGGSTSEPISYTPSTPSGVSSTPSLTPSSISLYPQIPKKVNTQPLKDNFNRQKKDEGMFSLLVKERGMFKTRGVYGSESEAFRKGVFITGQTAKASFKIINQRTDSFRANITDPRYRESKRSPGVIVQRNKYRISSLGEKAEISKKGRDVQQFRKKNRRLF